jgi:peptide/nickel transport system substrate-binding protein
MRVIRLSVGCLLLLSLFAAPLAGCRRGGRPATLVMAIEGPPRGFDPRLSTVSTFSARVMQLIYDTLVVRDESFQLVPSLAERFEESDDHERFTFHLRDGVTFHNGKPLRAADVKYTFTSLLSPDLKSPIRGALDKIAGIETPDPFTVVFKSTQPFYTFMGNLPAIGIVPQGADTQLIDAPVGSGPFRFVSYREGEAIRLDANPSYWGGVPGVEHLEIKVVSDNSTRQAELMSGEVDMAYNAGFDPETVRALRARRGMQVVLKEGANVDYLGLNLNAGSLLADGRVRQAIAYGIDRDVIIHRLLRDQARRAEAILPPEHWAYARQLSAYTPDLERAKGLLRDAGFNSGGDDDGRPQLRLTLLTSTTQISRNIASILQDQLRRIGVKIELQSLELATLLDKIGKGQFDLYYLRAIGFNQSTDVFQFVYHSRYQDSQFNTAIANLRGAKQPQEMKSLFDLIAGILARREYCPNPEVEELARRAAGMDSVAQPEAKRQGYLTIAGLLTDHGAQNRMRYCNPEVDRAIEQAEGVNDKARKIAIYSAVQNAVSEQLPQIYLWYPANVLIARSRVGNIRLDPSGSWYFIRGLTIEE